MRAGSTEGFGVVVGTTGARGNNAGIIADVGVPPHPVARIVVDGDAVTVNGAPVAWDGQGPAQAAAVHEVATRIAQPLERPVRAVATEATGRISLVVYPDGHTSDVRQLPRSDGDAAVVTAITPPAPAAAASNEVAEGSSHDSGQGAWRESRTVVAASEPVAVDPPAAIGPHAWLGLPSTAVAGAGVGRPALVAPVVAVVERLESRAAAKVAAKDLERDGGRSFLARHEDASPATTGWRGWLTRVGLRTGPSPAELLEREQVRAVSRHWPGPRTIAVVNGKGGAGKTPTTVLLSALFARHGGSGVLAWDNNETRGTLGWRTEQGPHQGHVLALLPDAGRLMLPDARAADLAAYVHHQSADKYDVLRSNPALLPHQQRLTAQDFDAVHQVAAKYYRLIVIDSGNDETAPHWLRMIDHADQLVVATTTRPDHAEAGRLLLEALHQRDERSAALADAAVVIVSQADREEASAHEIAAGFAGISRAAVTVPYDPAIRAPWLRLDALRPVTQDAYRAAAAVVAEGL